MPCVALARMLLLLPSSEDKPVDSQVYTLHFTTRNIYTLGGTLGGSTPLPQCPLLAAANCWGITECTTLLWNANLHPMLRISSLCHDGGSASACCEMNFQDGRVKYGLHLILSYFYIPPSPTFYISLMDIPLLLRLHSTVPARCFFPSTSTFFSARRTFLSFYAYILQCPQDISFLLRLHSSVPSGHFFPIRLHSTAPDRTLFPSFFSGKENLQQWSKKSDKFWPPQFMSNFLNMYKNARSLLN